MKSRELNFSGAYHNSLTSGCNARMLRQYGPTVLDFFRRYWRGIIGLNIDKLYLWTSNHGLLSTEGYEEFDSSHNKRPYFNSCNHLKTMVAVKPATYGVTYGSSGEYFTAYFTAPALNSYSPISINVATHPSVDLHQAQTTAWHTMQPRFEGDISMFNFLIELKDMRSLLHALRSKPLRKLRNYFRKERRRVDVTKPLAQTHLSVEFALKPLLNDILTISTQIEDKISEVQQNFADSGRENSLRHYTETFVTKSSDNRTTSAKKSQPGTPSGSYSTTIFTATMEYSYRYNMRSTLDAITKYWGFGSSREAIWNALPFSFLVDYFINLGDCIRLTEHDENVGLHLCQYCESLLSHNSAGNYVIPAKTIDGVTYLYGNNYHIIDKTHPNWHLLSGAQSELYTRWVCQPNYGIIVPRIKLPSSKQMLNLACLLRGFF